MANVIKAEMISIARWDNSISAWVNVYGKKSGGSATKFDEVVLYDNTTGQPTTSKLTASINWASFSIAGTSGYTLFDPSDALMIPSTTKSIKLRYKMRTTTDAASNAVVTSDNYYYQMINCDTPNTTAGSGITGVPATATSTLNITVVVQFPSFTQAMFTNTGQTLSNVQAYLGQSAKWKCWYTAPTGATTEYVPSTVSVSSTPTANSVNAEYGGYSVSVSLTFSLPITQSGSYAVNIGFLPNDGGTWEDVAFASGTATVSSIGGTPEYLVVYSFNSDVTVDIAFTTVSI